MTKSNTGSRAKVLRHAMSAGVAMALTGALSTVCTPAIAAEWSDNSISYLYGTRFRESYVPFNRNLPEVSIKKNIFNFTHVSGYKYGGNLFSVDFLKSDSNDPASGGSTQGAQDFYAVYRHDLSLSKISGTPMKWGIIRDVAITAGIDLSAKDTAFAARTWRPKIGPKLEFDVPNGFLNAALVLQTEKNHCGTCAGPTQTADPNFGSYGGFESAWGIGVGSLPLKFSGIFSYYAKKGNNGDTSPTGPETFLRTRLLYDIGSAFGKKDTVLVGLGYEYWKNQFGNTTTPVGYPFGGAGQPIPGIKTSTPLFIVEWHL